MTGARIEPAARGEPLPPGVDVEVYYDGACPMCSREIAWLRRLDRAGRIRFTDIAAPGFDPATTGLPMPSLMARIHGRLPDGTPIDGVEVFRRLYAAVGFGPLVALTRAPGISQALDLVYDAFAQRRLAMAGRCDAATCTVGTAGREPASRP